jgi:hypothetical protein
MLTDDQAREIVFDSIRKTVARRNPSLQRNILSTESLQDAGVGHHTLDELIETIATDPHVGVARFQHFLDPSGIGPRLTPTLKIDMLTRYILELSDGKICSNPDNPHKQTCCPYPDTCPECGYPVR